MKDLIIVGIICITLLCCVKIYTEEKMEECKLNNMVALKDLLFKQSLVIIQLKQQQVIDLSPPQNDKKQKI